MVTTFVGFHNYAGLLLVLFFGSLALFFRGYEILKGYAFTIMIFAAVSAAMYYPQHFIQIGDFKLSRLIIPLMQIIMFGMGTTLSLKDFGRVMQMPKGVIVGIVAQYSIMPLTGWALTKIFTFPPEIAAGIILIGSCPSGLASNVMSYLARANVALSVTLTALATLMAPLMTPMLMQLLAGQYVAIDFWGMVVDITKIIIVPVGAGLVFNHFLHGRFKVLDAIMPVISMLGIGLIIVVITSAGRDSLLVVGPLLILACFMHNADWLYAGVLGEQGIAHARKGLSDGSTRSRVAKCRTGFWIGAGHGEVINGRIGSGDFFANYEQHRVDIGAVVACSNKS